MKNEKWKMESSIKDLTLVEIRAAQAEIAGKMDNSQLSKADQRNLEKASLHLRNLERSMVNSVENTLVAELKNESSALKELVEEINKTSAQLFKITEILGKVVSTTGQLIDVLAKVV